MDAQDLEQSIPYKLGQMDTRLTQVERDVTEIKADVKTLVAALNQHKGSKGTIAAWGGGGVTVGGLLVAVAQWLGIGRDPPAPAPAAPPVVIRPQQHHPGEPVDPAVWGRTDGSVSSQATTQF